MRCACRPAGFGKVVPARFEAEGTKSQAAGIVFPSCSQYHPWPLLIFVLLSLTASSYSKVCRDSSSPCIAQRFIPGLRNSACWPSQSRRPETSTSFRCRWRNRNHIWLLHRELQWMSPCLSFKWKVRPLCRLFQACPCSFSRFGSSRYQAIFRSAVWSSWAALRRSGNRD